MKYYNRYKYGVIFKREYQNQSVLGKGKGIWEGFKEESVLELSQEK